jgi:hypothetical protein
MARAMAIRCFCPPDSYAQTRMCSSALAVEPQASQACAPGSPSARQPWRTWLGSRSRWCRGCWQLCVAGGLHARGDATLSSRAPGSGLDFLIGGLTRSTRVNETNLTQQPSHQSCRSECSPRWSCQTGAVPDPPSPAVRAQCAASGPQTALAAPHGTWLRRHSMFMSTSGMPSMLMRPPVVS